MNRDDRPRAVEVDLDARLRAAANALRDGSGTQVDAATGLREILHTTHALADPPPEPTGAIGAPHWSPTPSLLRNPQRLALAVNLLLVVVLGALIVRVATFDREPAAATSPTTASTAATTKVPAPATAPKVATTVQVPQACVDAADLADEIISKLDRNDRDQRLFSALRDYTIASQACRREAVSP